MKPWPGNKTAVVCGRIDDPYRQDVPESKVTQCWHCSEAVMISPATMVLVNENHLIICVECARGYYDESGRKMKVLPPTAAQTKERAGNL